MNKEGSNGPVPGELDSGGGSPGVDEIRIGDKVFKSVDDLKEAYRDAEANRRALASTVGRQGREMGELRGERQEEPPEDAYGIPKSVFEGFEEKFVANPGEAVKTLAKAIVETTEERMNKRMSSQSVIERFWNEYFDRYEKHRDIEPYIRAEADRLLRTGAFVGVDAYGQMDMIASNVERIGSRVFGKEGSTKDVPDKKIVTESGKGSGVTSTKTPAKAEPVKTFTEEFREMGYRKAAI